MDRVTVPEAARRLGITPDGVRKRINRGHIKSEKADDGRVYVYLDNTTTEADTLRDASATERLIGELQAHNEFLREQLEAERAANRENRRLLAAALERIPALEAPQDTPSEPQESPVSASEPRSGTQAPPERAEWPESAEGVQYGTSPQEAQESLHDQRPWWRRWFGA